MKVLVSGADGQLGKELCSQLSLREDVEILPTDISEMDICNIDSVRKVCFNFKPDIIINCAAHTAVDLCEDDEKRAMEINGNGAGNLSLIGNGIGARIVQISTDYVFDGKNSKPYTEEDATNPQSVYGKTKLEGEKQVIKYNPKHFIVRTAWLYGDGKNFLNTMIMLSKKTNLIKVVNDQIGSPTSTVELSKAILKIIGSEKYGIYHATCEGSCSWYDYAVRIFSYSGIDVNVEPCTSAEFIQKAKRPGYSVLENRALNLNLGYKLLDWDTALKEYIRGESK